MRDAATPPTPPPAGAERCAETIYVRDTYRRTGRTASGFEMHYNRERCSRRATHGAFCWQHAPENRPRLLAAAMERIRANRRRKAVR